MYSKSVELAGFGLLAWGIAVILGTGWGLVAGGGALLFVGSATDDAAVRATVTSGKRALRGLWVRYGLRVQLPHLPAKVSAEVACICNGRGECPICHGVGRVPNPEMWVGTGPHPPIIVSEEVQREAFAMASARRLRGDGRMREATP